MNDPHLTDGPFTITPIGAAALELSTCRGWDFEEAAQHLQDRYENDRTVPVSGMFTADDVRSFYEVEGVRVNVGPLPRTR